MADHLAYDTRVAHWRKNLRITAALLIVWFGVTFGATFFARDLSFRFFGWPFSFWWAAQGALLIYLALIAIYARFMNRLDAALEALEETGHG